MALRVCGTFLSLLLLSAQVVAAQIRQISGRVTNSQTEQGLGGATVAVIGTSIVAETSNDGNYVLNAPDGDRTLVVRAIGFKRRQVEVPAGQTTADAALDPDVFKLEEIVITGQATGVERRNLPNAVATVSSSELNRAPAQTVESALQGKIPGAYIQANSGAPGGGYQLNLRGVSTINASVDPLYVVDGIVVSNASIPNGAERGELRPVRRQPSQPGQSGQPHCRPQPGRHRTHRSTEGRLGGGDLWFQSHQRRGDHHHQAGPGRPTAVQHLTKVRILCPDQGAGLAHLCNTRRGTISLHRHRGRDRCIPAGQGVQFRRPVVRTQSIILSNRRQCERRHREHQVLHLGIGSERRRHCPEYWVQETVPAVQHRPGAWQRPPDPGEPGRDPQSVETWFI